MPAFLLLLMTLFSRQRTLWLLAMCLISMTDAQAARIKEVAAIEGVRSNQLTGFGLDVGLDGTVTRQPRCPIHPRV